jgi:hypothetical protein
MFGQVFVIRGTSTSSVHVDPRPMFQHSVYLKGEVKYDEASRFRFYALPHSCLLVDMLVQHEYMT